MILIQPLGERSANSWSMNFAGLSRCSDEISSADRLMSGFE